MTVIKHKRKDPSNSIQEHSEQENDDTEVDDRFNEDSDWDELQDGHRFHEDSDWDELQGVRIQRDEKGGLHFFV